MSLVKVGQVFRMKVKDTNPPKIKRFVLVSQSSDRVTLASVYINSKINLKVNFNILLKSHHIPLSKEGRDYLTKDCFVDCSQLKELISSELELHVKNNPKIIIGQLSTADLETLRNRIRDSEILKGKTKRRLGFFD
ncbi:hypothetical protein CLV98_102300 [Dyadobacter jejuensis]|uniref:mRNA interferase MazF n=1 Tax=Dyadobacter jejuensis TaxID=1082580 RepID=A0A316APV5_9BACT|nr:hypothetical protein [Dyadobacter jejuensis]PWJ59466.1 hypothetical protein CLV98_102300 [Dyadobacter jejuensis]